MRGVGVDFGTTNCAVAACDASEAEPRLAQFADSDHELRATFRSLLYFEREPGEELRHFAGPAAIQRYLAADEPGRLMQSLKSFLAARDFSITNVFGVSFRIEGLLGVLLQRLREQAEASLGTLSGPIVAGRPVRFVSARSAEDDELALTRLRAAFFNAGFPEVSFEYEPVAAAYHYERSLDHDEVILIADLGGGTSDFCILQVGPSRRSRSSTDLLLDTTGVPIAGDAFDGKIVRHTVSPLLGRGSQTVSMFGNVLDAPAWIYGHLERWHHLSFLRTRKSLQLLHDLIREAREPERFRALLYLVEHNLGFALYRAVEAAKRNLSRASSGRIELEEGPVRIAEELFETDFRTWIWPELERLDACVDELLERHGLGESEVDRVFLTGGSSFVGAVRKLFRDRFGADKIRSGRELTSVASGLALRAVELH